MQIILQDILSIYKLNPHQILLEENGEVSHHPIYQSEHKVATNPVC